MSVNTSAPLRRDVLLAFVLPTLVLGVMHGPQGQIQAIYAKHAGLTLTALAAVMLLVKIFDGITYPLIGYLSDRTYARSGSRKGWVIAGTILSVAGVWNLLRPPQGVDIHYFGTWMAVMYLGWKVAEIPLQAWSYGLSSDYVQRNRVQAWRSLAAAAGQLMFFAIPVVALKLGYSDTTELDFRSLALSAVVCAIGLPLATLAAVARVQDGTGAPPPVVRRPGLAELWSAIRNNGPLLRLLVGFLPVNLLGGMLGGVAYLYIDSYLKLGPQFSGIMMLSFVLSLAGIPFWSAVAGRYERHRVWAVSLALCGACCAAFMLVTPGPAALPMVFVIYPLFMFSFSGSILVFAMTADIVDYGRLVTGEDHAGLYGAIFQFLQRSLQGLSSAAGLAIAGLCGFEAAAETQSAGGVVGIKLTAALLPALGLLAAAAIIWNYSLTRTRVAEIQAQLGISKP